VLSGGGRGEDRHPRVWAQHVFLLRPAVGADPAGLPAVQSAVLSMGRALPVM
jgi:hypothetical protein